VLFALGIFNVGSFTGTRAAGFSSVGVNAWSLADNGNLTIRFVNRAGTQINITGIGYIYDGSNSNVSWTNASTVLGNGAVSGDIVIGATDIYNRGDFYGMKLDINYTDLKANFNYTDSGTLTGKVI
jgi:hypothetical protein